MDETSTLFFDATEALKTFKQLQVATTAYSQALEKNISASAAFNKGQNGLDDTLLLISKSAVEATTSLVNLAAAQKKVDDQAKKQSDLAKFGNRLDNFLKGRRITQDLLGGFNVDRAGATVPQLASFDTAVQNFRKLASTSAVTSQQVQKVLGNLGAVYEGTEKKIRDSIVQILQAQARLGGSNIRANDLLGIKELPNDVNKVTDASKNLFLSWQSVTRIFVGQAIFRAVSAITSEIGASVERAKELQVALAEVQTIAPPDLRNDAGRERLRGLTSQLTADFGISQIDAARGAYQAFSNQVGTTAETFQFLDTAARFAKASVTEFAASGDLISAVLNSYGLAVENAEAVSDKLFKTIDLGRTTGEELANSLGRVTPVAAQLGVNLDEFLSGLATITIQGVESEQALTQLENILKALIKPSDALKERFQQLGVASAEVGIARFGLFGFLKEITAGSTSIEQVGKFFDDVRELRGVLSVLNNDGQLLNETLSKFQANLNGSTEAASKLILETPAEQLKRTIETFQSIITGTIGENLVGAINGVTTAFGGAENAASAFLGILAAGTIAGTVAVVGQLTTSIGSLTVSLVSAATAGRVVLTTLAGFGVAAGVFAVAGAAIVGLSIALNEGRANSELLRSELLDSAKALNKENKTLIADQTEINRITKEAASNNAKAFIDSLSQRSAAQSQIRQQAEQFEKAVTANLKAEVQERARLVDSFVKDVENSIKKSADKIKAIGQDTRDFEFRINSARFDRRLDAFGGNQDAQAFEIQRRLSQLLSAQSKATSTDPDAAKKFNDEALSVANKLFSLQGRQAAGEAAVNKVLKARQQLNAELVSQEQQKAESAKNALPTLRGQSENIQEQAKQIELLIGQIAKGDIDSKQRGVLEGQLQTLAQGFQKSLEGVSLLNLKGFDSDIAKIKAGFDTLDGRQVTLDFVIDDSLDRVREKLNNLRLPVTLEAQLEAASGVGAGSNQINQLQQEAQKLLEAQKTGTDNSVGLEATRNTLARQEADIRNAIKRIRETLLSAQELNGTVGTAFGLLNPSSGQQRLADSSARLQGIVSKFDADLTTAIQNRDFTAVNALNEKLLAAVGNDGPGQDNSVVAGTVDQLRQLQSLISSVADTLPKLQTQEQARKDAEAAALKLQELSGIVDGNVDKIIQQNAQLQATGAAAQNGIGQATQQMEGLGRATDSVIEKYKLLNDLSNAPTLNSGGDAQGLSRGGLVRYFADGGFVPRGTDTIPAMLSKGEFVVNAAATRQFYSELVAINSGQFNQSAPRASTVNNNTWGDIHITVPSGSNEFQVRTIIKAVQRELRRGSSKL